MASSSILAIKASSLHPSLLGAARLLVAGIVLLPLYLRDSRAAGRDLRAMAVSARPALLPGAMLALHFITWNYGARSTLAANASLIVNLSPVAMPVIMYFLCRDRPRPRELIGTALALSGVFLLSGAGARLGADTLRGDLTCFLSMIFLTLYVALGRTNNRGSSLWLYVVPLYWVAGLLSLAISGPLVRAEGLWSAGSPASVLHLGAELFFPLYLGLFPTVVGHTIINRSMRVLPGQIVSIAILSQFIFAGILSFLLFGEVPSALFLPASLLVLSGALVTILDRR